VGEGMISPVFGLWRTFATYSPVLPISRILQIGTRRKLDAKERAAYEAPFPSAAFKAAPRVYPSLVPIRLGDPAREANLAAWKVLEAWDKPFICCFSDSDPITRGFDKPMLARIPGTRGQPHVTLKGGHFVQEDDAEGFSRVIVEAVGQRQ
jgi:haloalkane dehalogenase